MEYCHNVLKMHFDSIPFLFLNMMKKTYYIYSAYFRIASPSNG